MTKGIRILFILAILLFMIAGGAGGYAIGELTSHPSAHASYSPAAVSTVEITGDELFSFLRQSVHGMVYCDSPDTVYRVPSLSAFKQFLEVDDLNLYHYQKERFDCDDFAWVLKGRAAENSVPLGVVTLNQWKENENHRLNLFVTKEDGKLMVYLVEPQSDKVWPLNEEWQSKISFILF
jgi:hypothetical protein